MNQPQNNQVIEHIFRHEYGKMVGLLVHKYGTSNLEMVEDAVQDALLKAMQVWGYKNVPDNPSAWLYRVANNSLIDTLRKHQKNIDFELVSKTINETEKEKEEVQLNNAITDSQLKMIFACCNPSISTEYQIILSLKLIGGFSNREISKALLKKESTVAKSFTRAKQKLKLSVKTLDIPIEMGLASRVSTVVKVIYLLFTEGYKTTSGEQLIKRDICFEAIRLALLLLENKNSQLPEVHALIALMCFHTARFDARLTKEGEIIELEQQDRSKYNQQLIQIGNFHLREASKTKSQLSTYHFQAAVSYHYSAAENFKTINWKRILELYNMQLKSQYSPIIALNRLVSYYKVHGAKKGCQELKEYAQSSNSLKNALFYSIEFELLKDLGKLKEAKQAIKKAIVLTQNEVEKQHLIKKSITLDSL